jgi:hypothetical protein
MVAAMTCGYLLQCETNASGALHLSVLEVDVREVEVMKTTVLDTLDLEERRNMIASCLLLRTKRAAPDSDSLVVPKPEAGQSRLGQALPGPPLPGRFPR